MNHIINSTDIDNRLLDMHIKNIILYSFLLLFSVISFLSIIFLFIYYNPRLFRRSMWANLSEEWEKNKQERAAARTAKAEENKQKRIEELQAELDELNGNKD